MKILHCPTTVGGNPQGLVKAEKELGYNSESLTLSQTVYQYPADHVIWQKDDNLITRGYKRWKAVYKSLTQYDVLHYNFGSTIAPRKVRGNPTGFLKILKSIYQIFYGGIFSCIDLKIAQKNKIVTAVTYQGNDARLGDYCKKNYPIHFCHDPKQTYFTAESDAVKRELIEAFDQHVDLIYALNPDLLNVLPKRTKFMAYASVDPQVWIPAPLPKTPAKILHIIHAPSDRLTKGTQHILDAFTRLEKEGIPFKYTLIENMTNEEARKIYQTADLLIDQLLIGYYGGLSVELMALAKPVICYIREKDMCHMPSDMRDAMPIINATPDSIYDVLKQYLTTDKGQLRDIGLTSRQYVEDFHDPIKIATELTQDYERIYAEKHAQDS